MKFWKRDNNSFGTMDDDGHVPDSIEISEIEYNEHVDNIIQPQIPKSDMQKVIDYAKSQGWIE